MTTIRRATIADLQAITTLEALCFPTAEAASEDSFRRRLQTYPQHFLVIEHQGEIISFINGPVTREKDLIDEMYDTPTYHDEHGEWQMIFGLATHPYHQHQGHASRLMQAFIHEARLQGRKGLVLTCKEHKIPFYTTLGYTDEGLSTSTHGGVPWHQMRITFCESQ